MEKLFLNTSESNWHLEFANSLKKQKTIEIRNDNSLMHSDFESSINEIIETFTLKPWHDKVRKIFCILIPLASFSISVGVVYSIILQFNLNQTLIEIANAIYPLIFILIVSVVVSVKLIKA